MFYVVVSGSPGSREVFVHSFVGETCTIDGGSGLRLEEKAVAASVGVELEMKGEQEPRSFELAVHVENLGVAGGHVLVAEPELRGNDVGRQRFGKDVGNGVGNHVAVFVYVRLDVNGWQGAAQGMSECRGWRARRL